MGRFNSDVEDFSFTTSFSSPGPHTINLTASNSSGNVSPTWNDSVVVRSSAAAPLVTGKYDDTNPAWSYTGNWAVYNGSGPYLNTLHYSPTIGNSTTLSFEGVQFILTYTTNAYRGNLQVYVDDVLKTTINQNSASTVWQNTWTSGTFTFATHTVKLVHTSGTFADIDAIQIIGTPDTTAPAVINDLGAASGTLGASVDLTWTAVGDDGMTGTASSYLVRYSTSGAITNQTAWDNATPVTAGIPTTPKPAGQTENMTVSNLTPGQTYYFAVRAQDEAPNAGPISTVSPGAQPADILRSGKYDDTHTDWAYSGNWAVYNGPGPYNNTDHYSSTIGDYATIAFLGNKFSLTYTTNAARGKMDIYVDNVKLTTINQYSAVQVWQQTWTSSPLTYGAHVVKLVHVSGTYVDIDAIEVFEPAPPLESGKYDDAQSDWTYSGNWAVYNGSGPYLNTLHYSQSLGDFATLLFKGTQITLTYTTNGVRGNLQVYVDDVLQTTINQNSPTLVWQNTWTSGTFPLATHTVKLVHTSGIFADIDAIEIIGPPDTVLPAVIDDLQATTGVNLGAVDLTWTAVGDDGTSGKASNYLVRRSANPITDDNSWNNATAVILDIPTPPKSAGQMESMTVSNLTPGQTYYFAVRAQDEKPNTGDVSTNSPGAEAFAPDPPLNDNFSAAEPLDPMPFRDTTDYFYAATTEYTDGNPELPLLDPQIVQCNSNQGKYSIWYSYSPPDDGILTVNTFGTNQAYDTVVAIWTGDQSAFTHVACNDDANENTFLSEAVAYLYQGTDYYIEVVQYSQPPQNSPKASSPLPAPPIDEVVLNADFTAVELVGTGKYDDTSTTWAYSGNWAVYNGPGPYNNTDHYSSTVGDYATMAFLGNKFTLTYTTNPVRGNLDVYVDNVKVTTINEYSAGQVWQKTWTSGAFSNGVHFVKLVHASGAYVDIDAIEIFEPTPPLGNGKYDDTNPAWSYTGNWAVYNGSGPYLNTLHYSPTIGNSTTLSFEGVQFILTYTTNAYRGNLQVYVDDVLKTTINQNSASTVWQNTWTSGTFTFATHTVKLVHTSGTFADIDAIQIIGTPDTTAPAVINDLGAASGTLGASVDLTWTAVGDDGMTGTASSYLVRYSTSGAITNQTAWDNATPVTAGIPTTPKPAGQTENMTVSNLTPGQTYYFAVRAQDEAPNAGPISTVSPGAQPADILRSGKYDDTHTDWAYSGNWAVYNGPGPYNNTDHYSSTIGDYATIAFLGNKFSLTYTTNAARGKMDIYVDNVKLTTINQYSAVQVWQQTWTSSPLTYGAHVVKLVHVSGTYVDIDAIEVFEPAPPLESGKYDDAQSDWTYSGNWAVYNGSGPYLNTLHYSQSLGDFATLLFKGTQITLTYTTNSVRGNLQVYVDDVLQTTINQNSPTLVWQNTWTSGTFPLATHTVKLVHTSGTFADIDAIEITTPP